MNDEITKMVEPRKIVKRKRQEQKSGSGGNARAAAAAQVSSEICCMKVTSATKFLNKHRKSQSLLAGHQRNPPTCG